MTEPYRSFVAEGQHSFARIEIVPRTENAKPIEPTGNGSEPRSVVTSSKLGKILVVDDQRNMRTTLAMMLRGSGYEVDEAADGAMGREMGATGAYDVV